MDEKQAEAAAPVAVVGEENPATPVIQKQPVAGGPPPVLPVQPQPMIAGAQPPPYYPNPQPPVAGGAPVTTQQPSVAGAPSSQPPPVAGQPPLPGTVQPAPAGYPPGAPAGYPPGAPAGYPPGAPAGYPPGTAGPYLAAVGAATGGALADNLPPQQVIWMPSPSEVPPNCPPGLEYLTQIDQVLVHQQIELLELVTGYETENKYRVRNTLGQQVYFATEHSTPFQRQCCGPGRAFSMSISDNSQREVIHLERPQRVYWNCSGAVCYCCFSCCLPHMIEVQSPPGTVVGYVKQEPLGILNPWFSIQNADGETVLRMKGPQLGCSCYSDANFFVLSSDGTQEVGKISKQWGGLAKEYFTDADNFGIQFPMDLDVKMKAVMLGACFLIDFMFFESPGGSHNQHHHGGAYAGGVHHRHRHHHHHHHRRHHRHGRRH